MGKDKKREQKLKKTVIQINIYSTRLNEIYFLFRKKKLRFKINFKF